MGIVKTCYVVQKAVREGGREVEEEDMWEREGEAEEKREK